MTDMAYNPNTVTSIRTSTIRLSGKANSAITRAPSEMTANTQYSQHQEAVVAARPGLEATIRSIAESSSSSGEEEEEEEARRSSSTIDRWLRRGRSTTALVDAEETGGEPRYSSRTL